ncbi:MAG: branched-chain amino acid ABC transporter permease, partial [Patescibacteria group bacterium]
MDIADIAILPQLCVNGLIAGAIYSLPAVGFSLIYATNRFLHLAHGSVMMAGGYFLYFFFRMWHLPFIIASLAAIFGATALGALVFFAVYRPLRQKQGSNVVMLIASAGLLIFFHGLATLCFGADVKIVDVFDVAQGINILGALITPLQLFIIGISLLLLALVALFMKYTSYGRLIRAVADHSDLAQMSGINAHRVQAWSFVLASAIAGAAGVLVSLERNVEPAQGVGFAVISFTSTIIGGVGSIPGAIVGSYLIGLSENLGLWVFPSGYKEAIWLMMLFIFLLVRPTGIFGVEQGT